MDRYLQSCRLDGVLRCAVLRWKVLLSVRFVTEFVEPLNVKGHWVCDVGPSSTDGAHRKAPYPRGAVHDPF
jgi:hypothetical protein